MATKQINAVEITIRVPIPITYPLAATAHVEWAVPGLPEVSGGHKQITGSIPSSSITIGVILAAIKLQLEAALRDDGTGGHSVADQT